MGNQLLKTKASQMGFKKIKARVKNCRGAGPEFILKQFEENYDQWEEQIKDLDAKEKEELEEKFNTVVEDLGTALVDDKATFMMQKADLNNGQIKTFTDALCPDYFEVEDDE